MARTDTAAGLLPVTTEQIDRRMSLLQAAFDVIAEAGFEGLRTRAVAQRAGVNVATLHYYFPTKETLIHGLAEFLATIFATLHAPEAPSTGYRALDHLRQEFTDMHFYREHHPQLGIVLAELALRAGRDATVRAALDIMMGKWRYWIGTIVSTGIGDGTFRPGLDPEITTSTLMAILGGAPALGMEAVENIRLGVEEWLLAPAIKEKLKGANA
ncbi:TetR/AcrR family transcriptional regulator [Paracidobacterium acidisoli]|uniref:TetR/AcrR family transcriptional regulator n=1 Tax=Paracidobacterium acidisoli TaxID=2303751 RepID=A0A372IPY2_9BACT|nr:TetR family transcriptional regulator [Paracidobacterium acidisoli]MBT9331128.1 TetR family transcriptional regulator [Paracidobacterium acidisoli]